MVESIPHGVHKERDRLFDKEFGVETDETVEVSEFDIADNRLTTPYVATYVGTILALEPLFPKDLENYIFIDVGAGKGRVVLLVSRFPFKRVIGVEFVPKLFTILQRNIEKLSGHSKRCGALEIVQADVTQYELPIENTVFFLYNPMRRPALEKFIENLAASYNKTPRNLLVLFLNPRDALNDTKNLFERTGVFTVSYCETPEFKRVSHQDLMICRTPPLA
jgi:hypothetical protein